MNLIETQQKEIKAFLKLTEEDKIKIAFKYIEEYGFYPYDSRDFYGLKIVDPIKNNILMPDDAISKDLRQNIMNNTVIVMSVPTDESINPLKVGDVVVLGEANLISSSVDELKKLGLKGGAIILCNANQITLIKRKNA